MLGIILLAVFSFIIGYFFKDFLDKKNKLRKYKKDSIE